MWNVLSLPAIAEEDEYIPYDTLFGPAAYRRRAGDALHPARLSLKRLSEIRTEIGPYNFAAQYQQSPVPMEGNLVKRSWLVRYKTEDVKGLWILQSWDTANKAGELNDYSVCTTWAVRNRRGYLIDVFRKRLEFPDLKRAVRQLATAHKPRIILIEDKASGTQLVQDLTREGLRSVKPVKPPDGTDKIMRLNMHTAKFENGDVLLPETAAWLDAYIAELTGFPAGRHDDQVDSTTQALTFLDTYQPPFRISEAALEIARRGPSPYGYPYR